MLTLTQNKAIILLFFGRGEYFYPSNERLQNLELKSQRARVIVRKNMLPRKGLLHVLTTMLTVLLFIRFCLTLVSWICHRPLLTGKIFL